MKSIARILKSVSVPFFVGALFGALVLNANAALKGSAIFRDVPANAYYDDAVGKLYELGIIKGKTPTTYDPSAFVTRADLAVVAMRLREEIKGTSGYTVSSSSRSSSASSVSSVSSSVVSSSSSSSAGCSAVSYAAAGPQGSVRFTANGFTTQENAGQAVITIARVGGTQGTVSVEYAITAGTAKNSDFTASTGVLTFAGKETSKKLTIPIVDNTVVDSDRTVLLTLSKPTNGAVLSQPSCTTLTIFDNESINVSSSSGFVPSGPPVNPAGTFVFSATEYTVPENVSTLTVTVQRLGGSTGTATVNYTINPGTAYANTDYTGANGMLTFGPGEVSKTFTVSIINNNNIDGSRKALLALTTPTGGASLGTPSTADFVIADDESLTFGSGSLKFFSSTYSVNRTAGMAYVRVSRIGGVSSVAVSYSTNGGTALPGVHYAATSGVLEFAQHETVKVFPVVIYNNPAMTNSVTVSLGLASPTRGSTLGDPATATLTIQ